MRYKKILPIFLIVLAAVLAYWNSFDGVFVYDDIESIRDNPHIRKLWPPSEAFSLSQWTTGSTLDGRPFLSLSFAVNHAFFGNEPWGYHLGNLIIHIAAALLLFGIVRRTLIRMGVEGAGELALAVGLLWVVHPLQTESVTYISQRAESLMGMCYLLTLYCAIRALTGSEALKVEGSRFKVGDQMGGEVRGKEPVVSCQWEEGSGEQGTGNQEPRTKNQEPRTARLWQTVAVASCALGMAVKEVMITAPVAVLLYDYTFVSGSFRKALRCRRWFYTGLAASWLVTLGLLIGNRGDVAENYDVMPWISYLFAQPGVILHYLRLTIWPRPLVMDYNWPVGGWAIVVILQIVVVGGLLLLSLWGLWRRHWAGFAGTFFFLVLAPTSSILPTLQVAHEHRMYLPLAAVLTIVVAGIHILVSRISRRLIQIVILPIAVLFGIMTFQRNRDYRSEIELWRQNVINRPASFVAHCSLGQALQSQGRFAEAIEHYKTALRIKPEYVLAHNNMGNALQALGHPDQSIPYYREAVRVAPGYAEAQNNWGMALNALGQSKKAIAHYEKALAIDPKMARARLNLGNALQALGRTEEALVQYRKALETNPNYADAHNNMGNALLLLDMPDKAIPHYREALRLDPDHTAARQNLSAALKAMAGGQ